MRNMFYGDLAFPHASPANRQLIGPLWVEGTETVLTPAREMVEGDLRQGDAS